MKGRKVVRMRGSCEVEKSKEKRGKGRPIGRVEQKSTHKLECVFIMSQRDLKGIEGGSRGWVVD